MSKNAPNSAGYAGHGSTAAQAPVLRHHVIFCIMGTYFGLHIEAFDYNTRAIGAVMAAYSAAGRRRAGRSDRWVTSVFYGRHDGELRFPPREGAAGRAGTQRFHTSRTPGQVFSPLTAEQLRVLPNWRC